MDLFPANPQALYDRLFAVYGPQGWWPAETVMGMMVGAILVQNTTWIQASRAVDVLAFQGALTPEAIRRVEDETLWEWIRPAGFFRVKAKRLKSLAHFLGQYEDNLEILFDRDTVTLRQLLLSINGVGKETADCILCYGAKRPQFVVDAYTSRLLSRLNWVEEDSGYDEIQNLLQGGVPRDADLLGEYHALIVRHAKEHCRAKPLCPGCPLSFCPSHPKRG
jgi:endonuclease III related protein